VAATLLYNAANIATTAPSTPPVPIMTEAAPPVVCVEELALLVLLEEEPFVVVAIDVEELEDEASGAVMFLLHTSCVGTLTPSAPQSWPAYVIAVCWSALLHFSWRQQEMPSMKSLFAQMHEISSCLQPAILSPEVHSVTQGFWR
jgi:hypothetical protein